MSTIFKPITSEVKMSSFLRIPSEIMYGDTFRTLSLSAKILYSEILNRASLSIKNNWKDSNGRIYIIFPIDKIMKILHCSKAKAIHCLSELDSKKGMGLIEKKKLGLGMPNLIYVNDYTAIQDSQNIRDSSSDDKQNSDFDYPEAATDDNLVMSQKEPNIPESNNHRSDVVPTPMNELQHKLAFLLKKHTIDTDSQHEEAVSDSVADSAFYDEDNAETHAESSCNEQVSKADSRVSKLDFWGLKAGIAGSKSYTSEVYKTDSIKTHNKKTENKSDLSITKEPVHNNTNIHEEMMIDGMKKRSLFKTLFKKQLDYPVLCEEESRELVDEVIELLVDVVCSSAKEQRVNSCLVPTEAIRGRLLKLNYMHIKYVFKSLSRVTNKIRDIRRYMLTALYNAPITISRYYSMEVQHDLYG